MPAEITVGKVIKGIAGASGKAAPVLAPLSAYNVGSEGAALITAENKQARTEAAVGLTGAVASGAAFGAMALGAPVTLPLAAVAAAGLSAKYALSKMSVSAYYDLDSVFNPSLDTKRHMIGVGNGRFHKELTNPSTGKIDWGNMDTLNKYASLLTKRIHALEEGVQNNDSYIPDGMRAFTDSGMHAVTEQESRKSDLKIAQAAHRELQDQMSAVSQFRSYEGEALRAQAALTNGVSREITLLDLDRDHDGVLTEKDSADIRKTMGNDAVAALFFDALRQSDNITFDNQPLAALQPQPHVAAQHAETTPVLVSAQPTANPPQKGWLERIGSFFSGIIEYIGSFFTSKPESAAPASTATVSIAPAAQHESSPDFAPSPGRAVLAQQNMVRQ